jgi:uncharacterized protein (TIGR02231 family)
MPDVTAPIVAVTVYTDRAQVTRRGAITLSETGAQELTVSGLPTNIDSNSLRANGRGTAAVTIMGVESKVRYFSEPPREDVRDLQAQLQTLQDQAAELSNQGETLDKRLDVVQKLADTAASRYARSLAQGTVQIEAAQQLLDFISAQMQQVKQEKLKIAPQQRDNGKQQEVVQSQINQLSSPRQRQDNFISVPVEVGSAGEFELELTYVVYGASWQPLYDLRITSQPALSAPGQPSNGNAPLSAADGKLTLGYLASLSQSSGEDWAAVNLTLSTAQPSMGTLPPKLDPIYLDVYAPPPPPRIYAAAPMSAAAPAGEMARKAKRDQEADKGGALSFEPPMQEASIAQATVNSSGASVTFSLPRPLDVPSDGQPHRTMITSQDYDCRLDYSSVPRRASLGYLRATITNHSPLTLLPGSANIFRDGEYIGSTNLEMVAPQQEFKLFLGPDEQVRSERELVGREVDKTFIGNTRRNSYAYVIKLENLKSYPLRLVVQDQMPVSRSEQIKVKLNNIQPQAAEIDNLGIIRWELTLAPRSKMQLRYDYTVESNRDLRISGLED